MTKPAIDVYYWPTPNGWKVTILLDDRRRQENPLRPAGVALKNGPM
jgi:hypothetical protein